MGPSLIAGTFGTEELWYGRVGTTAIMAGLVLARVVDPVTAQQVVRLITGMGG